MRWVQQLTGSAKPGTDKIEDVARSKGGSWDRRDALTVVTHFPLPKQELPEATV
jgi:hypothetical protein